MYQGWKPRWVGELSLCVHPSQDGVEDASDGNKEDLFTSVMSSAVPQQEEVSIYQHLCCTRSYIMFVLSLLPVRNQ